MKIPKLPGDVDREMVQLVHMVPIGYDAEGNRIILDADGCHAFHVWLEADKGYGWVSVEKFDRDFPFRADAERYAWALAAAFGVQVEVEDG